MRICRVIPDHRALDRALDYLVPSELDADVAVGSIVRVPLQGRRVRGWVVADNVDPEAQRDRLRSVLEVVSIGPPPELVELTAWAAWRWAGPRAAFLRAASPALLVPALAAGAMESTGALAALQRVSQGGSQGELKTDGASCGGGPTIEAEALELAAEAKATAHAVVRWPPAIGVDALLSALLEGEGSGLVIAPDARAGVRQVELLRSRGIPTVMLRADQSARQRVAAWTRARRGNCVVVGGRLAAWVPLPDLRRIVVIDDLDESLQSERAPIWHARDLCAERARRGGVQITMVSPVPSLESTEPATQRFSPSRTTERAGWPLVEVIDRREDFSTPGALSSGLAKALQRTLETGDRVVCVLNRRGGARLLACRECRNIVRCENCGAAGAEDATVDPVELVCPRCSQRWPRLCTSCGSTRLSVVRAGIARLGRELAVLTRVAVGAVDAASKELPDTPVLIGTEAVLHRVMHAGLVAFLDFDQELFAPRYRAGEQALWLLVRAARLVGPRSVGGRILVQTRTPQHEVLRAALYADPDLFLVPESAQRAELGLPPFGAVAQLTGALPALEAVRTALMGEGLDVGGLSGVNADLSVRALNSSLLADALAKTLPAARSLGRLRVLVDPPRSF